LAESSTLIGVVVIASEGQLLRTDSRVEQGASLIAR